MTNVYVASYRHPLETAKAFATVDALSGGRLLLVWARPRGGEFDALGVPSRAAAPSPTRRSMRSSQPGRRVLGARRAALEVRRSGPGAAPGAAAAPAVWIGGSGKPALRRVARVGDGWIPQATPPDRWPTTSRTSCASVTTFARAPFRSRLPRLRVRRYAVVGAPQVRDETATTASSTGSNKLGAIGVSHVQVRFAARSASELCDQARAFGAEIGPHLTRIALS